MKACIISVILDSLYNVIQSIAVLLSKFMSLLELDDTVKEEDIVGVNIDQTFLSISMLEGLTTGKLEFFSEDRVQTRLVTDRPEGWTESDKSKVLDEQTDNYMPENEGLG